MVVQSVNRKLFLQRAAKLYQSWSDGLYSLSDVDSLVVAVGTSPDNNYNKSLTFQTWLFNMEFIDTLAVFTREGVFILASNKKADYFANVASETAQEGVPPIKVLHRNKADKDVDNFATIIDAMKQAGSRLGYFAKDKFDGVFFDGWKDAVDNGGFEKVDLTAKFSQFFAVKDSTEIELCKNAGTAASNLWASSRTRIVEIIDQDKKVKHSKVSADIDSTVGAPEVQGPVLSKAQIDTAYTPIIMSGGNYSFKWNTESDDKFINYGCIITSLGVRYENYCANITRTMLVNPSKNVEDAYEHMLATHADLIKALRPGARLSSVYETVLNSLKEKDQRLAENLHTKDFGFLTGVQFREGQMLISPKCEEKVQAGMVFVIYLGVDGIKNSNAKDDQGKKFAIAISDTVLVKDGDEPNEILTAKAKSRLKSILIRFSEENEQPESSAAANRANDELMTRGKRSVVLSDQTRNKATNEDKRKEHQKELMNQLNENARQRLAQQGGSADVKKTKKSNISYKSYDKFPQESEINKLNIYVDRRHESVIMPIFGIPVPFHISTIKNSSQSVEGEFTYLRVNFAHPGSNIGKDSALFPHPLATYLKELTFRASNLKEHGEVNPPSHYLSTAFRLIKEMQKRFRMDEAEEREKEGAVKQDKLILSQGKANPKLKDLYVRPNIIAKRVSGSIEAHINGFRYTSMRGDRIDVLYNNIKHAFFQPCDNEMIILLHFHLKNPVLWGKKKYKDIQFYTEVGEITTDLGKYHHMQDRDDVQSEQMEREMRRKLNQAFQNFCDKVVKQTNEQFDFDQPFSQLGFFGVPHRSSCTLKPTSTCLINLTEWPTFIVTLDDVELVHFERVSFQLKNFDMVFIFKDYSKRPQMVQQIPMTSLDNVKEWLNSCDLKYNEGIQSLNWPKIMKTITDNPEDFFNDGGWSFLDTQSDEEALDDESDSEDAYNPTDEDDGSDEEDSDEDEEEGSGSDDEGSGSDEGSLGSDESEGKDWSDLEEEAAKADRRREQEEPSGRDRDRDRDRKRHGGGSSKGGPSAKRRK